MPETFAQYLEKWLKHAAAQELNSPLVKIPVKRFRLLQPTEFDAKESGGSLTIGTMSDPISRNLYKNAQTRIRERSEHNAFICYGAVEATITSGTIQQQRGSLFGLQTDHKRAMDWAKCSSGINVHKRYL